MKCPQCGEESGIGKLCERCGKELSPQKEMEVEYREFKVSEVLDIRMIKNGGSAQTAEKTARERTEKGIPSRSEAKSGVDKSFIIIIIAIVFALAVIGGLYLFGFFTGF